MQVAGLVSGTTSRYLQEIHRLPMLEADEESVLAKRWREHGEEDAARKLVTSHLRLVAKIALGYRGYGLPISELISEGNLGLMQAVKRFDPNKGFRFATYAIWWIKAAIQEYILRSWSVVRIGTTSNQRKLFFNLRKAKSRISALEEGDLKSDQVQLIAQRLDTVCAITGLSTPTIYRAMAKGEFPRPVKITSYARAWKLSEIMQWVDSRDRDLGDVNVGEPGK